MIEPGVITSVRQSSMQQLKALPRCSIFPSIQCIFVQGAINPMTECVYYYLTINITPSAADLHNSKRHLLSEEARAVLQIESKKRTRASSRSRM